MSTRPAAETLECARALFETGASLRDIGREVGKSRETVRRWAMSGGWIAPEIVVGLDRQPRHMPSTEEIESARLRAEKAHQDARARWGVRRAEEADAVGADAAVVRRRIMDYVMEEGKASEARALAVVYGIFVDKAQIMSGEGPGRGRQGDELPVEPRPTDPAAMAEAGRARALRLMPAITAQSTES